MLASTLTYAERAAFCKSTIARDVFILMDEKKTNLALSADVTRAEELLSLADLLGNEICMLKTHIDIIEDFTPALTQTLRELAAKHRFVLFEDRKFADIGNTVKQQYAKGIYRIADWADIINAHSLPGPYIIQGLAEVGLKQNRGLLLLAEMSSAGNLLNQAYAEKTLKMAEAHDDFVMGFITQHALSNNPKWLNLTPGVQLAANTDGLGQVYQTPETAISENGNDIIIVGRGITHAENSLKMSQLYRQAGFDAYLKRVKS